MLFCRYRCWLAATTCCTQLFDFISKLTKQQLSAQTKRYLHNCQSYCELHCCRFQRRRSTVDVEKILLILSTLPSNDNGAVQKKMGSGRCTSINAVGVRRYSAENKKKQQRDDDDYGTGHAWQRTQIHTRHSINIHKFPVFVLFWTGLRAHIENVVRIVARTPINLRCFWTMSCWFVTLDRERLRLEG